MFFSRKPILFSLFLSALGLPTTSALADVWTFETPSKNIQCTVGEGVGLQSDITCTIIDRSGPDALPRPTACHSDWGHTFSMRERGPVEILCQETDRSKGGFDVANYGVTGNFGGFTCHSSQQGLKCTNRDGNGFFLSRRQQTIIGVARQQAGTAANPTQQNAIATQQGRSDTAPIQSAASAGNPTVASGHRFADHPSSDTLKSAAKFPDFNGRDSAFRNYRTRIRDGVGQGVNFAGHYSFVIIGCGTECRFGYVVDLRTGKVFDFPYGGEEHYQMDLLFSHDSRLVKVRWKGSWDSETCTEKDLLVEGTKWRILAERTVPTDDGLCFYDPDIPLDRYGTSGGSANISAATPAPETSAEFKSYDEDLKQHWLVTEQYLQTLGYDPGPVDGMVEAATVLAVHAFQKAYGLKVLNQLPPEHFTILEALAKAKTKPKSDLQSLQPSHKEGESQADTLTEDSRKAEISAGVAKAYSFRDTIIKDPTGILKVLETTLLPASFQTLKGPGVFSRLVSGSVPFVGCAADPVTAYGFYNVGQHVWLLTWIDRTTGKVVDTRLSSGFEPKSHHGSTTWYDLYSPSASVLGAMQHAMKIQTESFLELFPYEGCLASRKMDRIFSESLAIKAISEGLPPQTPESNALTSVMKADIASRYGLPEETELIPVMMVPDVLGFYRLSAFAPKSDPALLFVQGWKNNNGTLVLASSDTGMLIPQE